MTDEMKPIIRELFKFIFFGMYIAGAVVFKRSKKLTR